MKKMQRRNKTDKDGKPLDKDGKKDKDGKLQDIIRTSCSHLPLGDRVGHIGDGDSDCDSDDDGSCYDNLEDVASPPPILGHGLDLGQPRQDLGLRVGISFFIIL